MSEEQQAKKEAEEPRQPQGQQDVPVEGPWSVPSGPRIELPETDFEPLQPLEPSGLGEAIAQSFGVPEMPEFEPLVHDEGEEMRVPMSRPGAAPIGDVCPQGLAGLCIWCGMYPCDYMLKRALRFLLTRIEYGSAGEK